MPTETYPLIRLSREYGPALLLALLVHGLFLILLLTTRFSVPVQATSSTSTEPIISFLYQRPTVSPAPAVQPSSEPIEPANITALVELPLADNPSPQAGADDVSSTNLQPEPRATAAAAIDVASNAEPDNLAATINAESLVQRALNRASTPSQAEINRDANANYQQLLLQQQQPRLTVDKKHWPVSGNPAQQVVAQLNDGKHIVRIRKGVCVISDPTLDGFEGLMAARRVRCGDEVSTSELLKQALDKHIKR